MAIYEWDEFVNRYLENKEEFFFNYKNFSFWLTTDNNNLPCVTITNHELISSQSIDGLFKVLNIFEKFKDSNEILHVINKKLINISSYEDMKKLLINSNERFVLDENTQIYSYY